MEYVRLGDIAEIQTGPFGSQLHQSDYSETGVPVVMPKDLVNGKIIEDGIARVSQYHANRLKRHRLEEGDIVYARRGDVGRCAFVSEKEQGALCGTGCFRVKIKTDKADPNYVFLRCQSDSIVEWVKSRAVGSTLPNLNTGILSRIPLTLPSLSIQRKIASILSAYDSLIECNSKRIRLLEQMAENLYKEWFVRFRFPGHQNVKMKDGLPEGWKVCKIKNIVKRLPFNRLYKEYELEKVGNVIVIDQSTNDFLGYHNNEPSHKADFDNPILLFGDHSCKFKMMFEDFSLGENVIPFISNNPESLNDYYFFYSIHKLITTEEYKRHWGRLTSMKILVPDIHLQTRFMDIIKSKMVMIQSLQRQSTLLTRQRDLLLPRLMSGKLEV